MFASQTPLALPSSPFIHAAGLSLDSVPIAWCEFDQHHWHAELHHSWQLPLPTSLESAVTKRKAEFLASRWLVQQRVAQLDEPDFVLRNAPDRSPLWPAGIQASLSHTRNIAIFAATRDPLCIGVDVEQIMAEETADETAELLMSAAEKQRLLAQPLPFAQSATLLFSLKESLYKALWPQLHQPMDFLQAEVVELDVKQGHARLRLCQDFAPDFTGNTPLQARFWLSDAHVITLLTHPLPAK
ncbi:4'-phosphopantetheinyl transferase [Pantoea sp. GM01]|uniref:4'-phosphopantetheinyl transferase family protein n=1 Tax=Pantoea sp. GM01 TaxID=1144320 RepID=UPI000270F86F|nr:4'-phosphopantetheinyl transferase superfamily protein [Pantoea sp. GM01]EJL89404.1 phosphopantetheinyl transferase component of siderophore synthetase [Pantoea sp. GM01]